MAFWFQVCVRVRVVFVASTHFQWIKMTYRLLLVYDAVDSVEYETAN